MSGRRALNSLQVLFPRRYPVVIPLYKVCSNQRPRQLVFVISCIFPHTSYTSGLGGRYYFQIPDVSPVDVRCTSRTSVLLGSLKNHRLAWAGRDLEDHLVPTPCHRQVF